MGDYEFKVDAFTRMMAMSESSLYRKVKALTGQSPSVFMRSIRLKRAAALLASGQRDIV
jgi:AraC-like DNA-binding protein